MTKSGALGILWGRVGEMEGDRATGRGQGKGAAERCRSKALERGMKREYGSGIATCTRVSNSEQDSESIGPCTVPMNSFCVATLLTVVDK